MNKKSHYLDDLIKTWNEESKLEFEANQSYLISNIKGLKNNWKKKTLIDKIVLPMLCLYYFITIFTRPFGFAMLIGVLPFLAVTLLSYLQIKANNRITEIDLGLGVSEYRSKRLLILTGELKHLKLSRFIFYPSFLIYYLCEFLFIYNYPAEKMVLLLTVTLIGSFLLFLILETGIDEIKEQLHGLE